MGRVVTKGKRPRPARALCLMCKKGLEIQPDILEPLLNYCSVHIVRGTSPCGPTRCEQEGCNRKDSHVCAQYDTASLAGALDLRVPTELKNRHTYRSSADSYLAGKGGSKSESDTVCSVIETSRGANCGPTTQQQVTRSRVNRVSESSAAG